MVDPPYKEIGVIDDQNDLYFTKVHRFRPCNDPEVILSRLKGFSYSGHIIQVFSPKNFENKGI